MKKHQPKAFTPIVQVIAWSAINGLRETKPAEIEFLIKKQVGAHAWSESYSQPTLGL